MQAKFLIIVFWAGLVLGLLLSGPREIFRRPLLWVGAAVTPLLSVPTVLWQADHGWVYRSMPGVIAGQVEQAWGGRSAIVPMAVLTAGLFVGAFLVFHGCYCLLRAPELRSFRFFGWASIVVTIAIVVSAGRYYYLSGLYAVLFAASATRIEIRMPARWWRWVPTWPAFAVSALLGLYIALPVRPLGAFTGSALVDFLPVSSIGWPQLAATAADAYDQLPPDTRAHTVVMGDTYWQASALDVYGRADGIPRAYGPERGYWYMGRPPATTRQVLYVGGTSHTVGAYFDSVRQVGTVHLPHVDAEAANQGVPIWLCTGPRDAWPRLWARMYQP